MTSGISERFFFVYAGLGHLEAILLGASVWGTRGMEGRGD